MRPSLPLILIVLLVVGALTACGLKDDLYLPTPTEASDKKDTEADDAESP